MGSLWSRTGQRLATATFANETATGWQTVRFTTPVSITANTIKFRDGAAYVFAMQKRQYTSGTYTFTLTYSGSRFTDAFAAEYSHHLYRIVK